MKTLARPPVTLAAALACLLLAPRAGRAQGIHDAGNMNVSLGGSFAYTEFRDRRQNFEAEVTGEFDDTQFVSEPENYTDLDISVFLSGGYFVANGLELGVTGSTILTLYPEENQEDLEIYDLELFVKYYFDNRTQWTPYIEASGGWSFLSTGTYEETGDIWGAGLGVEFQGIGPFTFFVELSTEWTENRGSLSGTEWRNEVYLGMAFYPRFARRARGVVLPEEREVPDFEPEQEIDPETGLHPAQVEALRAMGIDPANLGKTPGGEEEEEEEEEETPPGEDQPETPGVPGNGAPSPRSEEVPGPSGTP